MAEWDSTRFHRDGFVTLVSFEEQTAVYIPVELVHSEHPILRQQPEIGVLGMDQVADLRTELDSLSKAADEQHRAVIEEATDLVDYSLQGGRSPIAVVWGGDAVE